MHICHLTISPIDYERRILNQAESGYQTGNDIWIVALGKRGEEIQEERETYTLWRIQSLFPKGGPLKFICFNWKLIWFLVFKQLDVIHCHDLWVLPAATLISLCKKCRMIYDAHEYYAGLEIFNRNKIRKQIWMIIEYLAIPRIDILLTVSEPLANLYRDRYSKLKQVEVIRNLPKKEDTCKDNSKGKLHNSNDKILLFQGHFKPGRGLENLLESIKYLDDVHLVLIGGGELEQRMRDIIEKNNITNKVTFKGYISTDLLIRVSAGADLGIALFESTSLNYTYALPNKFFEYIMAGIPVLASNIQTFQEYIDKYNVGLTVDPHNIPAIAKTIRSMISDEDKMIQWQKNARKASEELNWESESKKMNQIYEEIQY